MEDILSDIKINLKAAYEKDGAVHIPKVFDEHWIRKIQSGIQVFESCLTN